MSDRNEALERAKRAAERIIEQRADDMTKAELGTVLILAMCQLGLRMPDADGEGLPDVLADLVASADRVLRRER